MFLHISNEVMAVFQRALKINTINLLECGRSCSDRRLVDKLLQISNKTGQVAQFSLTGPTSGAQQ